MTPTCCDSYEIGFAAETGWRHVKEWKEGDAPLDPPPFDYVAELLEGRIAEICRVVGATEAPILYLTGSNNFREKVAKRAVYKGTRKELHKPWHYANLTAYMKGKYGAIVVEGMEADDAICIEQSRDIERARAYASGGEWGGCSPDWREHLGTIICTRDKDLRQCPGWHYGWELGNQPQFGPLLVDVIGKIELVKNNKEVKGYGMKFFYSQLLTGDRVDNIPGLPKFGPKAAYEILHSLESIEDMENAITRAYASVYPETWREEMKEQAQLLYMIRELDGEGNPKMWKFLDE